MSQRDADKFIQSNEFKVPPKQWRKWNLEAKTVFCRLYSFMYANQDLFIHPKSEPAEKRHWKTVAWNAAWVAADIAHNKTILMRETYE